MDPRDHVQMSRERYHALRRAAWHAAQPARMRGVAMADSPAWMQGVLEKTAEDAWRAVPRPRFHTDDELFWNQRKNRRRAAINLLHIVRAARRNGIPHWGDARDLREVVRIRLMVPVSPLPDRRAA